MYLVVAGKIALPWDAEDGSVSITDTYGNKLEIPQMTIFSLLFSVLSMTKAIVYFNIARVHVGVCNTDLNYFIHWK